jgi:hypothetical protein
MATRTRPAQPAPPIRPTITGLVPSDQTPGRSITVGAFIVEQINAGVDPVNAAGAAGVTPAELLSWMREGTMGVSRLNAGADWRKDFTREQQDCVVFADATIRARSAHIARLAVIAEQAARGGLKRRTVRTKRIGGQVVEEHTTEETTLPDLDMVRWKLEKLEPQVYGSKASLSITVQDMTDTDAVADTVGARMREIAERMRAAAIEATSSETDR